MPVGRKPKSTHLKLLEGNPGKRPLNENEPVSQPQARVVTPDELDEYGQIAWRRNVPKLKRMGLLTEADTDMLMLYCDAYSQWRYALAALARLDKLDADDFDGDEELERAQKEIPKAYRDLQISREKARTDMRMFAAELGLSASSRSRLSSGKGKAGDTDPMEELLGGRRAG